MIVEVPIRLVSEANSREHWSSAHARHKRQRNNVIWALYEKGVPKKMPVHVTMKKVGGRMMDEDNLIAAFKYIKDAIADYFIPGKAPGRADSSKEFMWSYDWEKRPKIHKIAICFEWPQECQ